MNLDKQFLLLAVASVFFIALVSAEPSFVFKQEENSSIELGCVNANNTACENTTLCTITITRPDGTSLVRNQSMTFVGAGFYQFNLSHTQNKVSGEYGGATICAGTTTASSTFTYLVSPTGEELTTASGMLYIIVLVLSILIFAFCVFWAIKIPFRNQRDDEGYIIQVNDLKYLKLFLWFFSYGIAIWITFMAWNLSLAFLKFDLTTSLFEYLFKFLTALALPVLILTMIVAFVNLAESKKIREALERGLPIR